MQSFWRRHTSIALELGVAPSDADDAGSAEQLTQKFGDNSWVIAEKQTTFLKFREQQRTIAERVQANRYRGCEICFSCFFVLHILDVYVVQNLSNSDWSFLHTTSAWSITDAKKTNNKYKSNNKKNMGCRATCKLQRCDSFLGPSKPLGKAFIKAF